MKRAAQRIVLQLLRGYKWIVSPMLPPACRYVPTCSEYAMEAVDRYGALRGGVMAFWRVLRCHPLAKGGYDPVARNQPDERGTNFDPPALTPIER
jgi:putative membrane protein insertion efficiency factor